ncbi:hypothetical protein BJY01DRAFT_98219 [Aspergillus pseudoustus]|uniref:Mid2 domain-containing protein n=1 Tax=Aspergillus pseudoustus TaxID=1810923 RepID=A0ABR4IZL4_9EURO
MTDYGPPYGYAVRRNNTCDNTANEIDCSNPWGEWHNCCPENTVCGDGGVCCPTDSGCSAPIERDPHCANNGTWDLYWLDSYFCCDSDTNGFSFSGLVFNGSQTTGVGCSEGYPSGEDTEVLVPESRGNETNTDSSSTSATPSSTSTSSQTESSAATATGLTDSDSSSSSTNTGAIAGGVVGGVAGLALILALVWFLMRRRRKPAAVDSSVAGAGTAQQPTPLKEQFAPQYPPQYVPHAELDNNAVRAELSGTTHPEGIPHELPGNMPER